MSFVSTSVSAWALNFPPTQKSRYLGTWMSNPFKRNFKAIKLNYRKCHIFYEYCWELLRIYTTKGRDRFHWAATPLKPYKVGNICHMAYRYSVFFFLNLSLKHFFSHRKRQFLRKYRNPETVIGPCFNVSQMPNRRTSQSKIEDIVHCNCISLLNGIFNQYATQSTPSKSYRRNTHLKHN